MEKAFLQSCATQQINTRWTVLRRLAISSLLISLALPSIARTRPHYGGTLRVEMEGDPLQRLDGLARRLVLDGLIATDTDGSSRPALAVEWKSESDDHHWQFQLRPGVHFHDGTPLTATTVVDSLNAICGSGCPWTAVHAVGSAVVFTSDSPLPNLPYLLASDQYRIALTQSMSTSPAPTLIGTGPFIFTQQNNGPLILNANDNSWQGRPFIDKIEIYGHKSIHDQWLDLSVGRADLTEVPAEQIRQAREQRLTVLTSSSTDLLALAVADNGVLGDPTLRSSIALAIDRTSLSNVIFQKQGEITASLLPASLTGYSFLFSTDRDVNKAHELRGGLTPAQLTLAAEGGATMQLAGQRIALNLHEAGFNVQVVAASQHADMTLLRRTLETREPQPALELLLREVGVQSTVLENTPAGLYRVEREFLDTHTLIPLLYLPRAYAVGGRVRELRLDADGSPLLANLSLQDAPADSTGATP
jgi:peptide/nickel transport system substrate-binding protein